MQPTAETMHPSGEEHSTALLLPDSDGKVVSKHPDPIEASKDDSALDGNSVKEPNPKKRKYSNAESPRIAKAGTTDSNDDGEDKAEQEGEMFETDGSKRRSLCYRDEIYDKTSRKWTLVKSTEDTDLPKLYKDYALVVYRKYSEKMEYLCTTVLVQSSVITNVLKEVFGDAAGLNLDEPELHVHPRYFYWARAHLMSARDRYKQIDNNDSLFDIDAVLDFITTRYSAMMASLDVILPHSITFPFLWAILPPDTLVVGTDDLGERRVYLVRSHEIMKKQDGSVGLVLAAEHVDSDGSTFGLASSSLVIPQFFGRQSIEDLPFIPLYLHPQKDAIRKEIILRNRKHLVYHQKEPQMKEYSGHALTMSNDKTSKYNVHKRIIIDPVGFRKLCPHDCWVPTLANFRKSTQKIAIRDANGETDKHDTGSQTDKLNPLDYSYGDDHYTVQLRRRKRRPGWEAMPVDSKDGEAVMRGEHLTEEQILLLSGRVYGYSLGDGVWSTFAISSCSDIDWNDAMFESLVMAPDLKMLVSNLIRAHAFGSSGFDDVVRGKGKGLTGLLFGAPGLGKTLTAEAIAEVSRLPLYTVSSGSLGHESDVIEYNLTRILQLTTRWNAVLLIDEADIFLAKRDKSDLKRNAIVSVFLRELEYYPGILLLTTNQASIIDPAFKSRIHFCHHYPALDSSARSKIWTDFLRRTETAGNVKVSVTSDEIAELSKLDINGRQIKNVMSMAVKLASYSNSVLDFTSLKAAAASFEEFSKIHDED